MQSNLIRTSQPQGNVGINWAHPMSRGLVVAALPLGSSGVDILGGPVTRLGNGIISSGPEGRGFQSTLSNIGGWRFRSLSGAVSSILVLDSNITGSPSWEYDTVHSGGRNSDNGPYTEFKLSSSTTLTGAGTSVSIAVNGQVANVTPSSLNATGSGLIYLGWGTNSANLPRNALFANIRDSDENTSYPGKARVYALLQWNRLLSNQEFRYLTIPENVWQLFQPEKRSRLWAAPVPSVKMTPLPAKGPSIITKPRTQQPQRAVNGTFHPWLKTRGAVLVDFANGIEVVSNNVLINGDPLKYTRRVSSAGIGLGASSVSQNDSARIYLSRSVSQSSNALTVFFYGSVGTAATEEAFISWQADSVSSLGQYNFLVNSSERLRLEIRSAAAWYSAIGSQTISANQVYFFVGTYDGVTIRVYVNGLLDGSTARSGTLENTVQNVEFLRHNRVNNAFPYHLSGVGIFAGILPNYVASDREILSISRNPWQLFAPQDRLWLPTYSDRVIPQLSNPTVANPTSTGGTPRYTITY